MFEAMFKTGIKSIYSIEDTPKFSVGGWKIYLAKHRQTGKRVSVFIFDRSKFESQISRLHSQSTASGNLKLIIEDTFRILRFEVSQLTRLKHPQILSVVEPIEETKLKFIFVTEPINWTLAKLQIPEGDKLSIVKGLHEVGKALQFLHNNCNIVHHDVQPNSIFITEAGDWKLGGFKFLKLMDDLSFTERENYLMSNSVSIVPFANINLDFAAPEMLMDGFGERITPSNDIWSLAVLIYWLYNDGEQLINCFDKTSLSDYRAEFRSLERKLQNTNNPNLKFVFKEIPAIHWKDYASLLRKNSRERFSIDRFLALSFFQNSFIKVVLSLEEFSTKLPSEKILFIDDLLKDDELSKKLPSSLIATKLVPTLVDTIISELNILKDSASQSDETMLIGRAMKLLLSVGGNLSANSFRDRIYKPLLEPKKKSKKEQAYEKLIQSTTQVRLAIVESVEVLIAKLQSEEVAVIMQNLAELSLTATDSDFENDQTLLQNTYLDKVPLVALTYEYSYLKKTLVPLLCSVFKTTTILSTKICTVVTFQKLVELSIIDKDILSEQILPVIENLKSRNKAIIEPVLSFFETLIFESKIRLGVDEAVSKILCQCLRLLFSCTDCDKETFEALQRKVSAIQNNLAFKKISDLADSPAVAAADNNYMPGTLLTSHVSTSSARQHNGRSSKQVDQEKSKFQNSALGYLKPKQIVLPLNQTSFSWATETNQENKSVSSMDTISGLHFTPPEVVKKGPPGFAGHLVLTPRKA